jgi:hypothetical protein
MQFDLTKRSQLFDIKSKAIKLKGASKSRGDSSNNYHNLIQTDGFFCSKIIIIIRGEKVGLN